MQILEILSWLFFLPSIIGSLWVSDAKIPRKKAFWANLMFTITNAYGVIFMLFNMHWGYFVQLSLFLIFSMRGIIKNRPIKEKNITNMLIKDIAKATGISEEVLRIKDEYLEKQKKAERIIRDALGIDGTVKFDPIYDEFPVL